MQRRFFMGKAAAASAAVVVAPSVQAQSNVRWRMSTAWPKSVENMYGSAEDLCERVSQLSGGRFQIRAFSGGEIVPPPQNMEAVSNGTVECNHTLASFHIGKNTALAFDAGLSFGMNARQHNAWVMHGGGMGRLRKLYKKYGIVNFVSGNVGVQMGGWFRKEIKSVADLQGLKMRIGGIGGMVMSRLGALPQQIPPGDIYPSLEKGAIDAAEFIGPHDDLKLGLQKVAPFYYSPGWFEGSASMTTMVNEKAWNELSPEFKAMFEVACNEQALSMLARYDATNPAALKQLVAGGAKLMYFPRDVMDAAYKVSQEIWKEQSEKNPDFAEIFPQWQTFQRDQIDWFKVAESALDGYTFNAVSRR